MGWNDRDYNPGREEMRGYMANPGAMLQFSLPIYRSPGLHITLTFWFLLSALFDSITIIRMQMPLYFVGLSIAAMLVAVLWHELGHRVLARMVGGNHWEWVLWPLGGMVAPTAPRRPWPTFVANVGGIAFSLVMAVGAYFAVQMVYGIPRLAAQSSFYPITLFLTSPMGFFIGRLVSSSVFIILYNLFPAFWFDGGHIWTSVLWPKLGLWKATRIVCMAGMILSVPLAMMALLATDFLNLIFWALIFADCYRRRQMLAAAGPGVMDEDDAPSYNYMDTDTPRSRKKSLKKKWFGSSLRKKARAEQAEQAKIDAILVKVKEKGLHSLTWWEKRTLKKATERQRQQDLAERL